MQETKFPYPSATTIRSWARRAALPVLLAGLLFVISGCTSQHEDLPSSATKGTPPPSTGELTGAAGTPQDALADFYHWYTLYPGDPFERQAYRSNAYLRPHLTTSFVQRIDRMVNTLAVSEKYDPFICGELWASRFEYEPLGEENDAAQVLVHRYNVEKPQSMEMIVKLVRVDDAWRIDDINCLQAQQPATPTPTQIAPPPIESPEGIMSRAILWHTFYRATPHFRIDYPGAWYTSETQVSARFDHDPVDSYLTFIASDGSETPFALIISSGSMEDFRLSFPVEEGSVEERTINGYNVLVEEHFDGELYYIFQHPDDPEQRVALRVVTHGQPPDATMQTIINRMLATFIFE